MERPEIRTERLRLRPLEISDADRVVEFIGDYEVSKWLARVQHPYEMDHALDWIERNQTARPADESGLVLDMGDGLIGSIGFHLIEDVPSLGYWLAKPHWGKGLMSEAAEAVIAWLFEVTDHNQVRSGVLEGNGASLRIQEKLGFKIVGKSLLHSLAQGKDLPQVETLLTRTCFEGRNA